MKRILFAFALAALASYPALTQDAKTPSRFLHNTTKASQPPATARTWGLPNLRGDIVFYGGDSDPNDPNSQSFANENTLLVSDTSVYAAVTAPTAGKVTVSAVFFSVASTIGGIFDPPTGTYDIRTGVSNGDCGTELAKGSGPQTTVATGRPLFGIPEYFAKVAFAKPLTAQDGVTYWFNETPQCTNNSDSNCDSAEYFFDNTIDETNGVNADAQPPYQMYENSEYFGLTCANLCGSGEAPGCKYGSWGLLK